MSPLSPEKYFVETEAAAKLSRAERVELYDRQHREIIAKYGQNLPPPRENLRICTVIPAAAELSNDNFWTLLRSLSTQQDVDKQALEIIYVINNTELGAQYGRSGSAPAERADDTHEQAGTKVNILARRYRENQRHLKIIGLLQRAVEESRSPVSRLFFTQKYGKKLEKLGLSEYERKIFRQAVNAGIQVVAVDASSPDKALPDERRTNPVAFARNIGGHIAAERLGGRGGQVLIDFLDGDCFVSPRYYSELLALKTAYPGCQVVLKPMVSVVTELPQEIKTQRLPTQRLYNLVRFIRSHATGYRLNYPTLILKNYRSDGAPSDYTQLGGPQLAVAPDLFRDLPGYTMSSVDADFFFSGRAIREAKPTSRILIMEEEKVYVSDRSRPGSVDGSSRVPSGARRLSSQAMLEDLVDLSVNESDVRRHRYQAYADADKIASDLPEGWGERYQQIAGRCRRQENLRQRFFLAEAKNILDLTLASILSGADKLPDEVPLTDAERDYFERNKVVVQAIVLLREILRDDFSLVVRLLELDPDSPAPRTAEEYRDYVLKFFETVLPSEFVLPGEVDNNLRDIVHVPLALHQLSAEIYNQKTSGRSLSLNLSSKIDKLRDALY